MRYLPHRALPERAYIPGQTDRPADKDASTPLSRPDREFMMSDDYLWGIDLYNTGFVWEAHEAWEALWRVSDPGPARELLQGLIQCAAAAVKVAQNNPSGTRTVSARAQSHLHAAGQPLLGLDVASFAGAFATWIASEPDTIASRPLLELRVRSRDRPGTLTDLYVEPTSSVRVARETYLVRKTPSRPDYYFGQVVIADDPVNATDLEDWLSIFDGELSGIPLHRRLLCWETGTADPWPWAGELEAHWSYEHTLVMRADATGPMHAPPDGVELRRLASDADWDAVVELAASMEDTIPRGIYEPFIRWRYVERRSSLQGGGRGAFWGAFAQDRLAGSLGLLGEAGWMRFQDVMTAERDRRRGICAALISRALHDGFAAHPRAITYLGVHAESNAVRVYKRAGFRVIGSQHTLSTAA